MSQSQTLSRWARIRQSDLVYYFLKDKVAMVCMAVFLGYVALALLSPWIAPMIPTIRPATTSWMPSCRPPGWKGR